ncbi:MAG: helix-turn-helix domain-containing protein [Ruminococcus sp.]|nr:helix-turn-helix domain-containing protein [Ruminococcus sp.]
MPYSNKDKVVISMKFDFQYFSSIRDEYPETVSKDQFYRIAHISKSTALYLLESGKVPCKDNGNLTHRFTIRMDDIIFYLIDREVHPDEYRAPRDWYSGRPIRHKPKSFRIKTLCILTSDEREAFHEYIENELTEYDDVLTVSDVTEFTGYSDSAIRNWCKDKRVKSFYISKKYLIPKPCFIDFLVSPYCCNIDRKTWKHLALFSGFHEKQRIEKLSGQD